MRDLIDRDELIDMLKSAIAIQKSLSIRIGADNDPVIQMGIKTYTDILNHVKKMSPVEQECKTGKWIQKEKGVTVTSYECSECGRIVRDDTGYDVYTDYSYCHCGAKMNEESHQSSDARDVDENEWVWDKDNIMYKCPKCGFDYSPKGYEDGTVDFSYNYCPNCGIKMKNPGDRNEH